MTVDDILAMLRDKYPGWMEIMEPLFPTLAKFGGPVIEEVITNLQAGDYRKFFLTIAQETTNMDESFMILDQLVELQAKALDKCENLDKGTLQLLTIILTTMVPMLLFGGEV